MEHETVHQYPDAEASENAGTTDGQVVLDGLKKLFPNAHVEPGDTPNETVFEFFDGTPALD